MRLQARSILLTARKANAVGRELAVLVVAVETILRLTLAVVVRDGVEVGAEVRAGTVGAGAVVAVGDVLEGVVVPVLAVVGAGVGRDGSSWAKGFAGIDGARTDGVSESAAIATRHATH